MDRRRSAHASKKPITIGCGLEKRDDNLPAALAPYAESLHALPAVARWRTAAAKAPRIPVYDAYIEQLGGQVFDAPPNG